MSQKKAGSRPADFRVIVRRRLGLRTSNHRIDESLITFRTNDDHLPYVRLLTFACLCVKGRGRSYARAIRAGFGGASF